MVLTYVISRNEISKKKPKVRKKDVCGAQPEHRNAEPVITVLKRMKETEIYRAG